MIFFFHLVGARRARTIGISVQKMRTRQNPVEKRDDNGGLLFALAMAPCTSLSNTMLSPTNILQNTLLSRLVQKVIRVVPSIAQKQAVEARPVKNNNTIPEAPSFACISIRSQNCSFQQQPMRLECYY
jgi:hypothetical protein